MATENMFRFTLLSLSLLSFSIHAMESNKQNKQLKSYLNYELFKTVRDIRIELDKALELDKNNGEFCQSGLKICPSPNCKFYKPTIQGLCLTIDCSGTPDLLHTPWGTLDITGSYRGKLNNLKNKTKTIFLTQLITKGCNYYISQNHSCQYSLSAILKFKNKTLPELKLYEEHDLTKKLLDKIEKAWDEMATKDGKKSWLYSSLEGTRES